MYEVPPLEVGPAAMLNLAGDHRPLPHRRDRHVTSGVVDDLFTGANNLVEGQRRVSSGCRTGLGSFRCAKGPR